MPRPKSSRSLAKELAKSADNLKAIDIAILDLGNLTSFTDYFVICSGSSNRHMQSIADRIISDQKKAGNPPLGVEGYGSDEWVLIDFGGAVVHVFHPETRTFYNIEKFWGDAKKVKLK